MLRLRPTMALVTHRKVVRSHDTLWQDECCLDSVRRMNHERCRFGVNDSDALGECESRFPQRVPAQRMQYDELAEVNQSVYE